MSELDNLIAIVETHQVDDHIGWHGWGVTAKKIVEWLHYFMARSCLWKLAAKEWRDAYHSIDTSTATRRKELLEDVRKFLDRIYAEYTEDIISSGDLGEIYKRVEKELEND